MCDIERSETFPPSDSRAAFWKFSIVKCVKSVYRSRNVPSLYECIHLRNKSEIIVITGGLGFIGKHFVKRCLDKGMYVKLIDNISYAADLHVLSEFSKYKQFRFYEKDIVELESLPECDLFVNFAAESHVDNAITSSQKFCKTNFLGVQTCLELLRQKHEFERPVFIQVSTDEVYGDIKSGSHVETDMLIPSNPYAATKAAADMLLMSWGRTYGVAWNIVRPTNNYGMHQYPEKLIPKSTWRMLRNMPAIMHGDGSYIRSWLHVEDTVDAILTVIEKGERNNIYNIGSGEEMANIDVLRLIAAAVGVDEEHAWKAVTDRSGQDIRYSLDDSKLRALGWVARRRFREELPAIVASFDSSRFA